MDKFNALLKFLGDLWGPPGLSRELQQYCEREGVDPWALLDAEKKARAQKKESKVVQMRRRSVPRPAVLVRPSV